MFFRTLMCIYDLNVRRMQWLYQTFHQKICFKFSEIFSMTPPDTPPRILPQIPQEVLQRTLEGNPPGFHQGFHQGFLLLFVQIFSYFFQECLQGQRLSHKELMYENSTTK